MLVIHTASSNLIIGEPVFQLILVWPEDVQYNISGIHEKETESQKR
jgi:hypothetical protein